MVVVGVIVRRVVVMRHVGWILMFGFVVMSVMIVVAFLVGMLEPDNRCVSGERTKHHGKHKQPCGEGGEQASWFERSHR